MRFLFKTDYEDDIRLLPHSGYAVTYGVANEETIKTTTFGVSLIGESYINFGIFGVVILMMAQGVLIAILQHVFGSTESGPGGQAEASPARPSPG